MVPMQSVAGRFPARRSSLPPQRPARVALSTVAVAMALAVGWSATAQADPELIVGSVNNFKTLSSGTGNPAGTWTLGDKDYTYLDSSATTGTTGWLGFEVIKIRENANPALLSHEFLIDSLSNYSAPRSLYLGYHVHINGSQGPYTFRDVSLSQTFSGQTVEIWKDVFGSLADYNANPGTNTGTLAKLYFNSTTGTVPLAVTMPPGLTDLWVRDTFALSGLGGSISSFNNTLRQTPVPEIDPQSFAGVAALVAGVIGLRERRGRRPGAA